MKWIFAVMALIANPAVSDDRIQKESESSTDTLVNRVCEPHFRNLEVTLNQSMKLHNALRNHKGDSKENLMYKIELMNAISMMQDTEKSISRKIDDCSKNLR